MREIVTIQLGNCGNSLGSMFWEEVSEEHGLLPNGAYCGYHDLQLQQIDSFFTAGAAHNYVPRCVLVDLDPTSLETCRCSPIGQLFRPDNFIFGKAGASNNFARGHFTDGVDIRDMTSEVIRKEVELCDTISGFQMVHAVGGGTGSGMGALLIKMLKDEYPKSLMLNYTVTPSSKVSDAVVEPINACLACSSLINYSDVTISLDNERLCDICEKTLRLESPSYGDLNQVMAKVMTGMSATYRFPSSSHMGWRSMRCVMVPAPKIHFFIPGYVPLNSRGVQAYRTFSVQDITYQMLNMLEGSNNVYMGNIRRNRGKYMTCLALYRGFNIQNDDVTDQLCNFEERNPTEFVEWMPYHFLKGTCQTPPKGMKISATFLANHTHSVEMWRRALAGFQKMFRRKAFIHFFYAEGMGEDDFKQAEEQVKCLVDEYKECEVCPPKGWVSLDDNQLMKKCVEEEQLIRVEEAPKRNIIPGKYPYCWKFN